jgi:hypothetical protein
MWGAKTVRTVVARASIGAAVSLATLLTLLPSRVRRKWFERLRSLGRRVDNLLNSTVLFGIDPLADLSALEAGLLPQTADVDERAENRIVERILAAYWKAKADQKGAPRVYQPYGEWGDVIKTTRGEYLAALERSDSLELSRLLRDFFRNCGADGLLTTGYFPEISTASTRKKRAFICAMLQDYSSWKDLTGNTSPRPLAAPAIGNPWGYLIDRQLVMPGACRHNYFAHQACALLSDIPGVPVVAEIGGGFGGVAYFLLSMMDKCRYIDFDLPEILLLEQYYLMSAFPKKKFLLYGEHQVEFRCALESYDVILMPNFEFPKLPDASVDVFVNTGSLSEMEYATVEEYIDQIARTCRLYFFHDNSDREEPKGRRVEIPASRFPIPARIFRKVYKAKSPWVGMGEERFREHLYRRLAPLATLAQQR